MGKDSSSSFPHPTMLFILQAFSFSLSSTYQRGQKGPLLFPFFSSSTTISLLIQARMWSRDYGQYDFWSTFTLQNNPLFETSLFNWTYNCRTEKEKGLEKWCMYILECTLRWASLDSSWVWVTNSDPMHHQRFLYFSSLFFSSQVYLLLNHVHAIQWLSHYNEVSGEQLTHLHCSQQPWEIMIINNDAPNYINTMLNLPGKI